jgi:hypothetical protein
MENNPNVWNHQPDWYFHITNQYIDGSSHLPKTCDETCCWKYTKSLVAWVPAAQKQLLLEKDIGIQKKQI